jgi:fluoroquinolone transport system permease protein
MKNLIKLILWEFRLAARHQILAVTIFMTFAYMAVLLYFRNAEIKELVLFLIFSDPSMLGFIFIGAMVLFEKNANTLSAIAVSPIKNWQYLWSKGIVFSVIALAISIVMIKTGYSSRVNYFFLALAVIGTSLFFAFLGFIAVIRVKTFNQYILVIPLFLIPLCYLLMSLFGIFDHGSMLIFPTYAAIILLKASIQPVGMIELIYSGSFLALSTFLAYIAATKSLSSYLSNNFSIQ